MPKGRSRGGANHKGQRRHFTNPDQLAHNSEKKEKERQWRQQRGELSSDEEDSEKSESSSSATSSEEESETEEDKQVKAKGVQHLIEVENPNRIVKKEKKVETLKLDETNSTQLSRREREELEKQRAKQHYQKMHAAGKTNEAKADLARLAIIKKQREEAAKRKEEQMKAKEEAEKAKADLTKKALGRRS